MQAAKEHAAAEGLRAEVGQLKRQLEPLAGERARLEAELQAAQSRVQQLEQTLVRTLLSPLFSLSTGLLQFT